MNRPEIYHRSVNALVKAYIDDVLEPLCCQACAVGNIIADVHGYKVTPMHHINPALNSNGCIWINEKGEMLMAKWVWIKSGEFTAALAEIASTGYTVAEILSIECAFMKGRCIGGDYFDNLMNTIDELDRIHEVNDPKISSQAKKKFVKPIAV